MAYDESNPPRLISQGIGSNAEGTREWVYSDADPVADVNTDGYITNGVALGMKQGDLVRVVDNDASPPTTTLLVVAHTNSDGSVDLSDGTSITVTDSD